MTTEYVKDSNAALFASLSEPEALNLASPQNYIPLYGRLFDLTPSNSRNLNLPYSLRITEAASTSAPLEFQAKVADQNSVQKDVVIFFKLSPLLDPLRYITGRYDIADPSLFSLPGLEGAPCHRKLTDPNNSAYVDGFFCYLCSILRHKHRFVNAIDSYGSFLAVRRGFVVDVAEDLDHLASSDFFAEHEGNLFEFDDAARAHFSRGLGTGRRKSPIKLEGALDVAEPEDIGASAGDLDSIFTPAGPPEAPGLEIVFESQNGCGPAKKRSMDRRSSECSSRSSGTDGSGSACDDPVSEGSDVGSAETGSDAGTISSIGEEACNLVLKSFPVQCIALERCEATLDALMLQKKLSPAEWESAMFQVIASLWVYNRCFRLTHNDLHTNNIMYVNTDKQYVLYKIGGCHYKVPTFGRIFKIIDFGRAIYEYAGRRMCSDSYHKKGDAATQYNCEPYLNPRRPRLEPNPSFDLCRLGCALYDFLMDEYSNSEFSLPAVVEMITGWCTDDKGRNVMYKSTGEERYPDFKLYKMIVRTVHKHTPSAALETPCMQRYVVARSSLGRKARIMNLDAIPTYSPAPGDS